MERKDRFPSPQCPSPQAPSPHADLVSKMPSKRRNLTVCKTLLLASSVSQKGHMDEHVLLILRMFTCTLGNQCSTLLS